MRRNLMSVFQQRSRSTFLKCRAPYAAARSLAAGERSQSSILAAINPIYGITFMLTHGQAGLLALGAVFLTVTGAEALYADMGHFGSKAIRAAWLIVVMPSLLLNYLGQGA